MTCVTKNKYIMYNVQDYSVLFFILKCMYQVRKVSCHVHFVFVS